MRHRLLRSQLTHVENYDFALYTRREQCAVTAPTDLTKFEIHAGNVNPSKVRPSCCAYTSAHFRIEKVRRFLEGFNQAYRLRLLWTQLPDAKQMQTATCKHSVVWTESETPNSTVLLMG